MLMAVSAGAMAEWTKTGGTDGFDNYADLSTIQKSGSTAKMWVLQDFKKTQTLYVGKSYLSIMFRYEYDCNEKKSRLLSIHTYSGNMRNGDIVLQEENVKEWHSILPESIAATNLKIACGTK